MILLILAGHSLSSAFGCRWVDSITDLGWTLRFEAPAGITVLD